MTKFEFYLVGGAVRDLLLQHPSADDDYVVVGATEAQMLAAGFKRVGKDFPVFLHPDTGAEYALARTERRVGRGHRGFVVHASPDITLEQDLRRRDLTINAMAMQPGGQIIDPYGGERDLREGRLRHVSLAFAEDPLRVLRVARFAARYTRFQVAQETMKLMRAMVAQGALDELTPERVWKELSRGLLEAKPSRMFAVLRECGALAKVLPEVDRLWGVPQPPKHHPEIDTGDHVMRVVDEAAKENMGLDERFAALCHDLGKGVTPARYWPSHHNHEALGVPLVQEVCKRLKVPTSCRDLAVMAAREHTLVHTARQLRASTLVDLFERTDARKRPERFEALLRVCRCDARGRLGSEDAAYPQADYVRAALKRVLEVDAGAVAARCVDHSRIPEKVHAARVHSLADMPGLQAEVAAA